MSKPFLILDFDGTIADTLDALVSIYNELAPFYRCRRVRDEDRLKLQAQRPQDFLQSYGVTKWKLPFLLLNVKRRLRKDVESLELIEGMKEALEELHKEGYKLGIMSSNSVQNIRTFLKLKGLNKYFEFIHSGKNVFGKEKVLRKLLRKYNLSKDSTIYIGDETRDVEAVKKVSLPILAVTWGFNSKSILEASNPDLIVDHPSLLIPSLAKLH